ncbi:MAG: phosphoethanolamine transferase [Mucilaginibacter sp.]
MLFIGLSEFIYQLTRPDVYQAIIILTWITAVFLLPVYLFKNRIKLYLLLLTPIFITIPLNIVYILSFDNNVSSDLMMLFLNTNRHETGELFHEYYPVLIPLYLIYAAALYFVVRNIPSVLPSKTAIYISLIAFGIIVTGPLLDVKYGEKNYYDTARTNFFNVYPTSMIKGINRYIEEKRTIIRTQKSRDEFNYFAKADTSISGKQIIILVVGESSRYFSWGINGYGRNTSPKLSKRENLISFSNTVSGAYATENAVPLILTGVGAPDFETHYNRKGIIGAFNEAGFDTFWLSNQPGDNGSISVHAIEAKHQFNFMEDKSRDKDMDMLEQFKAIINMPGDKKFIVMHTMGSHFDYSDRYPDNYDFFKPSNKTIRSKVNDLKFRNVMVNSYDNSIRYTDAVLDSIISIAKSQNSFSSVVYISDHGEDLLDDKRHFTHHINASPPSKYVIHVPLFIWYSPQVQQKYPEKILNLSMHKDSATSSQNIIYTLTSIAGITYPKQYPAMDITSPGFKNNPQLFLGEAQQLYPYTVCK